ncbi:MAG: hypothetical protein GEU81_14805, partial [Nitriliruptorales bacterium]|nr:hypothetical protein [Nitriliruptorales bacterium]
MARQSTRSPASRRKRTFSRRQRRKGASTPGKKKPAGGGSTSRAQDTTQRLPGRSPRKTAKQPVIDDDRIRDVWGIALLVLAVLSGLALWVDDAAGMLGTWLEVAFRGLFGLLGLLVPVALVAIGVAYLQEAKPVHGRVAIGAGLVALATAGLVHLANGAPTLDAPIQELQDAAGWTGAGASLPLQTLAGRSGAVVILLAIVVAGLSVATATPPRAVARYLTSGVRTLRERRRERASAKAADSTPETRRLPDGEDENESGDGETVVLYDGVDGREDQPQTDEPELSDTRLLPRGVPASDAVPAGDG